MSRPAQRLFSSSLRLSTPSRVALNRRVMSSHASHGGSTSDKPWMVGSALVFGPLFLYLVSPSARKGSHGHQGHKSHHDEPKDKHQHVESHQDVIPIADDEGTEVSEQDVKESMEKAYEADSPKDAQEREEVIAKVEATAVEGTTATEPPQTTSLPDGGSVPEPELSPAPSVKDDEATHATSDEKVQDTAVSTSSLSFSE